MEEADGGKRKETEVEAVEEEEEESVKLFVGQVPKHMTESDLLSLFQEFALVDEISLIKDKATRSSRGSCLRIVFLQFSGFAWLRNPDSESFGVRNRVLRPCFLWLLPLCRVLLRGLSVQEGGG